MTWILKKKRKEKDRILIDKRRKVERTPCQILKEYSAYTGDEKYCELLEGRRKTCTT